jgi:hypothetical protein
LGAVSRSNEACIQTPPSIHPSVPAALAADPLSPGQVSLSWQASTGDFSGYRIYRDGVRLASISEASYTDSTARPATHACYTVTAYDPWGYESPQSGPACATTPADTEAPGVPTGVDVQFSPGPDATFTSQVTWTGAADNSGTVAGYRVYRNGAFLAQLTETWYADPGLGATTQYCYTVTAVDGSGNESAASTPACATTSWSLTTVDGTVDARWTAIALDADGVPHLAYYDGRYLGFNTVDGTVHHAVLRSGTWRTEAIDRVALDIYASLALLADSAGALHVAYYDYSLYRLRHAVNASGVWLLETIDPHALNVTTVAMARDAADNLHLAYNPYGTVLYLTNAGGAWASLPVGGNVGYGYGGATTCAIAVDAAGGAHVAEYDIKARLLRHTTNASGAWVGEVVDAGADVGLHTAIAVDAGGRVHIAYYDATHGDLRYATNASGAWVARTVDSAGDVGQYAAIALDPAGRVHISYMDATSQSLKYATNVSGLWMTYALDRQVATGYTAIAVDAAGRVHVSYRGGYSVKYATNR